MSETRKDLGENDASFVDTVSNMAEKATDAISHKLHPMVEQYATLFKNRARTPVLRRPDDYGMEYQDVLVSALRTTPPSIRRHACPATRPRR